MSNHKNFSGAEPKDLNKIKMLNKLKSIVDNSDASVSSQEILKKRRHPRKLELFVAKIWLSRAIFLICEGCLMANNFAQKQFLVNPSI